MYGRELRPFVGQNTRRRMVTTNWQIYLYKQFKQQFMYSSIVNLVTK
jgi:hypothetical protein